jgi:hypothetical protein
MIELMNHRQFNHFLFSSTMLIRTPILLARFLLSIKRDKG